MRIRMDLHSNPLKVRKNIINHKSDTAMNEENITTENKRQIIASKNGETLLWKRTVLVFFLNKSNNTFF